MRENSQVDIKVLACRFSVMELITEMRKSEYEVLLPEREKDEECSLEQVEFEMSNICSSVGVSRQSVVQAWDLRLIKDLKL